MGTIIVFLEMSFRKRLGFRILSKRSQRRRVHEISPNSSTSSSSLENYLLQSADSSDEVDIDYNILTTSTNIVHLTPSEEVLSSNHNNWRNCDSMSDNNLYSDKSSTKETYVTDSSSKSISDDTSIILCPDETLVKESNSEVNDLKIFLRTWSVQHNIPCNDVSDLLSGLNRTVSSLDSLPTTAKSLLKTCKTNFSKIVVDPGEYIHIGLENQLNRILSTVKNNINKFQLLINIDGLPIFKSSYIQVIPISFCVLNNYELKHKVFPVGIYCGHGKPDNMSNFFKEFLDEYIQLFENGILLNGTLISIEIVGIFADAPEKCDILGNKGHGGYYSCTRCTVKGETINKRRVFTDIDCPLRTSEDFINWIDPEYRLKYTAFVRIPH